IAIVMFDRVIMRLAAQENEAERRYAAGVLDFLGNVSTVLSLRLQQASRTMIGKRLAAVFVPLRKNILVTEAKWCAVDLMSIGLTWSLVIAYAWHAQSTGSVLLLGGVFMVYQYAQQAGGVIGAMCAHFQNFSRIRTDVASAKPIWEAAPRAIGGGDASKDWREIGIRGLEFTYARADGERGGIEEATLTIKRGERIALVGPSGGGKSTLMRLIAGLYEPQRGVYSVDGIAHVDLRHLGGIATLIPQEAEVFEATVRDNITFGMPHDTDVIRAAARISCFDAVVDAMPQGLETPLSERGFNLSGGQRQRLSLARGLLAARDSSLVLLDEPTSALDQLTEARVFTRLRELQETTVIASVHRMSLLQHFDRVVLMAAGRVVDVGTVEELMQRQALFRDMLLGAEAQEGGTPGPRPLAA
ncbi:MAG TPA: ABC transporter ATP-binding protein, partial [Burkholderiaceae bacterium]|nr:ABC transporter ATP-binding protein [Burkholderiaceae bacterium]